MTDTEGRPLSRSGSVAPTPARTLEWTLEVTGAGRSSWVPVGEVGQQVRLEWSAADPGHAGHVAVALDGRLALWVDGFAPTAPAASARLLRPSPPGVE